MCNARDVCVIFYYFDILLCILFITSYKALVLIQISTILNRQRRIRPGIGIEVEMILKTWDTKNIECHVYSVFLCKQFLISNRSNVTISEIN